MKAELVSASVSVAPARAGLALPTLITAAGEAARWKFLEFFTAQLRNPHTRRAYAHAVTDFFAWVDQRGLTSLTQLNPVVIAAYLEELQATKSKPTVKQHLAAIRMLFDWLVVGQIVPMNPAASVRGPKFVVKRGKTPVLTPEQARELLDSIDTSSLIGLRDRALIGVMVFSFARIGAVTGMKIADYYQNGKKWWLRFQEKGGKRHDVPAHHNAEAYLDAYLEAAELWGEPQAFLFQTVKKGDQLSGRKMAQADAWRMLRRRALAAGLGVQICNHTFRATGITAYLSNKGTLEKAQQIAGHESPRTTKLYDRTSDAISLDEIERIVI